MKHLALERPLSQNAGLSREHKIAGHWQSTMDVLDRYERKEIKWQAACEFLQDLLYVREVRQDAVLSSICETALFISIYGRSKDNPGEERWEQLIAVVRQIVLQNAKLENLCEQWCWT